MKKLLTMIFILVFNTVVYAASPIINNVTGTIANGQTLTITGTNLMNENTSSWDANFANNSAMYGFEGSLPPSGGTIVSGWAMEPGASSSNVTFDTSTKLSGNQSLKMTISGTCSASSCGNAGMMSYPASSQSTQYWRYYCYFNAAGNLWPSNFMKQYGLQPGYGSAIDYLDIGSGPTGGGSPTSLNIAPSGQDYSVTIPSSGMVNGRWYLFEGQEVGGTWQWWMDNKLIFTGSIGGTPTISIVPFGIINYGGSANNVNLTEWMDNYAYGASKRIYASSLIEISGDGGSTWVYQPPISLSDTSVSIAVESLPTLTAANYILRVTNNTQLVAAAGNTATAGGVTYNLSGSAINGACGSASGQSFSSLNSGSPNLCSAGTVSNFTTGTGPWSWICSGSNGGSNSGTCSASLTSDTTPPTVITFTIPTSAAGLTIPITTFTANDNVGVTGYLITESSTPPLSSATGWTSSVPTTYTAASAGSHTLYPWAKDAAGNVSAAYQTPQTVVITLSTGTSATTLLFSENFEDENFAARGWYDNTNHGTIASGGQSGNCLQWAWTSGQTTPTNGGSMRYNNFTPTDTLYLSYYVKFQTGWEGSQQTYHPHMMYILSDLDNAANAYSPLADNYLNTYVEFLSDIGSPYTIRPQIALQDEIRTNTSNGTPPNNITAITENRSVNYCNTPVSSGATGTCYADVTYYSANTWKAASASVSTNAWHHIEVYFQMNSISGGIGQHDGIMQEWVDGTQVMNHSDVLYRTNQDSTKKWAQFVLAPYIGTGSPITQTMWIDSLQVWNGNPNSSSTSMSAPAGFAVKSASPN